MSPLYLVMQSWWPLPNGSCRLSICLGLYTQLIMLCIARLLVMPLSGGLLIEIGTRGLPHFLAVLTMKVGLPLDTNHPLFKVDGCPPLP